jgi:hypothetical protein
MRTRICCAAAIVAVMTCGTLAVGPAFGQQLVGSFEQSLVSTAGGTSFGGQWTASPDYTTTGATEGTHALAVHHSPSWVTDGLFLKAGLPLAQQAAANDFLIIDMTTSDLGIAGDGKAPGFRQVFVIFNSNSGGWQQTQLDFPVAADDGNSLTSQVILDLGSSGVKANAQTYVDSGSTAGNAHRELFLVFQGADQGTVKAGDYADDSLVNAADYVNWRKNFGGTSLANETVSLGSVDSEDYTEWKAKFGSDYSKITTIVDNVRFATAGSGAVLGVAGVPEPTSALLVLIACSAIAVGRRGRRAIEV